MPTLQDIFGVGVTQAGDGAITIPATTLTAGGIAVPATATPPQILAVILKNASESTAALTDESYPLDVVARPFTSTFRDNEDKRLDAYECNLYSTFIASPLDPDNIL